ncbi:junctional sarcoplasmic reticulum protein 1 isoform X2 [Sminthopsis crassicaudata]|uniref:junctional sarcoplasmic reticulum protein 1 isoform X2 n=1 Tax=Sminthopsis crassicaudata TaxID=9301 RepID=UPI003D681270
MATGDLEVLDRGLGFPETIEELTMSTERSRKQSQEKAKGDEQTESRDEGLVEEEHALDGEGSRGARPSKAKAEKERGKTTAAPKSAPARKKSKAPSQLKLPRTLGPGSDELPWGEITLNKCLALASVVAVLSVAFQLFQDVIDGEDEGPEAAPTLWAWPGGSAPRDSQAKLPKPKNWAKASAPAPPPGPKPPVKDTPEAPPKEQEAEAKGSLAPAPALEAAIPPEEPPPSSQPAKSEKPAGAAMPRKEEKARNRKGSREDRAEPPWRERKEGGHGPRPRREEPEEAPRRPWQREHRHSGKREDSKKARDGPRSKREEQRGRQKHEDRERFFPKQKLREGKHRD